MTGTPEIWTYDAFHEGQDLGTVAVRLDGERLGLWSDVFGRRADDAPVSQSILVSAMMEAYLKVAQPRPPGNVHAAQKVRLFGRAPKLGHELEITTRCAQKSERKGRKWITFISEVKTAGELLLDGEMLVIWAR